MRRHGVRCLLMGGQACVFYGAAEFSRDVDFAILGEPENLRRLQAALHELKAEVIAIPAFEESYLHRGLAIHFRCQAPGVEGLRVDVMTVMRGVDPFPELWERRTTIAIDNTVILFGSRADDRAKGGDIDLLIISDRIGLHQEWNIRRDILDEIGWQKLDLIVRRSNQLDSPIASVAMETGIPL
jgi:predicted nucleotidyltransferase